MPKVVSNSSPIIHLAKIGKLELLKEYFQTITVPEAVYRECVPEGKVREEVEIIKNADWIKVMQVESKKIVRLLQSLLDDGESEAIALSLEIGADLILLDDSDAREKARLYGLKITGTIGILLQAKIERKIDSLKENLDRLKKTGFWLSNKLETRLLMEVDEQP
jgi:predicted nucleic acid-binding protein